MDLQLIAWSCSLSSSGPNHVDCRPTLVNDLCNSLQVCFDGFFFSTLHVFHLNLKSLSIATISKAYTTFSSNEVPRVDSFIFVRNRSMPFCCWFKVERQKLFVDEVNSFVNLYPDRALVLKLL